MGGDPGGAKAPDQNASTGSLDELPSEIKVLILLNIPDPSSLRALVRASPSYHELYTRQRRHLLSISLFNNLHIDVLHTALTVEEASRMSHVPDEYGELYDLYEEKKALRARYFGYPLPSSKHMSPQWLQSLDFDTLISVIHRHWIITAIASRYFEEKTSTNPVTGEPESIATSSYSQPSRSESHRIHRALYCFELYCLLFVSHYISGSDSKVTLHYVERQWSITSFFPLLDSWEIEEIACIREYVMLCYSKIFRNSAAELSKNEKVAVARGTSLEEHETVDPNELWISEDDLRKEYLMSCGLKLFSTLSQTSNVQEQAAIASRYPWQRDHFLTKATLSYRKHLNADRSLRGEKYKTVIPFTSDNDDGPNAALQWSRFSDLEFFFKGRDFLRSWGYVFWDLERLKQWKVLEQDPEVWLGDQEVAISLTANCLGNVCRRF